MTTLPCLQFTKQVVGDTANVELSSVLVQNPVWTICRRCKIRCRYLCLWKWLGFSARILGWKKWKLSRALGDMPSYRWGRKGMIMAAVTIDYDPHVWHQRHQTGRTYRDSLSAVILIKETFRKNCCLYRKLEVLDKAYRWLIKAK